MKITKNELLSTMVGSDRKFRIKGLNHYVNLNFVLKQNVNIKDHFQHCLKYLISSNFVLENKNMPFISMLKVIIYSTQFHIHYNHLIKALKTHFFLWSQPSFNFSKVNLIHKLQKSKISCQPFIQFIFKFQLVQLYLPADIHCIWIIIVLFRSRLILY